MKILFIAMTNSIHTARWIRMISDLGWKIYVFPTDFLLPQHPDLKNVRVFNSKVINYFVSKQKRLQDKKSSIQAVKNSINKEFVNIGKPQITNSCTFSGFLREFLNKRFYNFKVKRLVTVIKKIKPDIIHSLHIQEAGYLTLDAKNRYKGNFPKWIVTNWGSDIHLFGNIKNQRKKIIGVLKNCNFYSAECQRDIELAKKLGFNGKSLSVFPNSGGIDFEFIKQIRNPVLPSKRKKIILKGYQGWSGRALVGLYALERCRNLLNGYEIVIFNSNSVEVEIAAELFKEKNDIRVEIIPMNSLYERILREFGQSRIYIGLSITDAISTSLLEAMAMGTFPIQSSTSCAKEWIEDGKTAILVEPEDPESVEKAIKKALNDDKLVNNAAKINYETLFNRVEYSKVKKAVIAQYEEIVK